MRNSPDRAGDAFQYRAGEWARGNSGYRKGLKSVAVSFVGLR